MPDLRSEVLILAAARPELSSHLLPLIKTAGPITGRRSYVLLMSSRPGKDNYAGEIADFTEDDDDLREKLSRLSPGEDYRAPDGTRYVKIDAMAVPRPGLTWMYVIFDDGDDVPYLDREDNLVLNGVDPKALRYIPGGAQEPVPFTLSNGERLRVLPARAFRRPRGTTITQVRVRG